MEGLDPPGLWTWPAAQSLAYLAPFTWVQGVMNQHDRVSALGHMARCEQTRQVQEATGGSKRKRAPRGFQNYLVVNLGLPECVKDELGMLCDKTNRWKSTQSPDSYRLA